ARVGVVVAACRFATAAAIVTQNAELVEELVAAGGSGGEDATAAAAVVAGCWRPASLPKDDNNGTTRHFPIAAGVAAADFAAAPIFVDPADIPKSMVNNASTAVVVRRTRLALLPHTGIERHWLYLASVHPAVGLRLAATALGAGVRPASATRALSTGATGGGGGEADSTQSPPPPPPKKKGIVRSILLGSGDDGEFFPEKHSKLAARGKYVHKLL
ncbi:hypothetical protein HK405_002499, partial [Cladochytrium tenue]